MTTGKTAAMQFNIAYHPSPYPDCLRENLNDIAQVCDGIYMPFTEADLAYMSKKIKLCVEIAHDLSLIVLGDFWGYGNLFASGGIASHFTIQHPEHNCVTNAGRTIPKSCPSKAPVRAFMKDAIEEFIEVYGVNGVFWDEPSFGLQAYLGPMGEDEWACRCDDCQKGFRDTYGTEMPTELTPEVEEFRSRTVLSFLSDLCGYTKACGEHLITSTCVMPSDSPSFRRAVAQTEDLDIFGIDPYWWPDNDVSQKDYIDKYVRETLRMGRENGKLVESWVAAWKPVAGHETDAYRAAKLNAAHSIDTLSAWSYRDYVSWDPCTRENAADPELVWKHLRRAYHEIREGDLEIEL